jgi:hypothetical protein
MQCADEAVDDHTQNERVWFGLHPSEEMRERRQGYVQGRALGEDVGCEKSLYREVPK